MNVALSAAWDGIASSVVEGSIGGAVVLAGVLLTFRYEERKRREDLMRLEARDRRAAANRLIVAVHNMRDAAVSSKDSDSGNFHIWPLREALLLSQRELGTFPSYEAAEEFYDRVEDYRAWARAFPPPGEDGRSKRAEGHRQLLDDNGDRVLWLLQHKHDDPEATTDDMPTNRPADQQTPM